ncbi:hypothetical protein CMO96_04920 [Candidatus Woesebacteria bacterium]|nr:hypothetical protein [Candidatus Woesebacteria bacterium]
MTHHDRGLHHFHVRKRIYQKYEPYPHPNKWKRFVDKFIYVVAIVSPLMTTHQVAKIWLEQDPSGVSVITWGASVATGSFWLTYGILHKARPIILASSLGILLSISIVIGILLYR